MKTVLITGTSSGIGLETAALLAQRGYSVIATMRNLAKRAALETRLSELGATAEILELDAQSDDSVAAAIASVIERHGRIDALVNNAGAGHLGAMEQTPLTDAMRVMDQNFWSAWRMTTAVMPAMRAAGSGRIISVSSIGGLVGQPFNDAYCAAKFALEGMMESFAPLADSFGVCVSLIERGPVHTAFTANVGGIGNAQSADAYAPLMSAYMGYITKNFAGNGQTPREIAAVILATLQAEQPHFRVQTSDAVRVRAASKLQDLTGDAQIAGMRQMLGA